MNVPAAEYKSQTINEIIQSDQNKSVEIGKLKAKLSIVKKDLIDLKTEIFITRPINDNLIGRIETILNHIRQ